MLQNLLILASMQKYPQKDIPFSNRETQGQICEWKKIKRHHHPYQDHAC